MRKEIKIDPIVTAQLADLAKTVKELKFQAGGAISKVLGTDIAKLKEAVRKYKAGLPDKLKTLAMNGWFIYGFRTPSRVIYPIASTFEAGRRDEANNAMCWHFDRVASEVEADLSKRFPNRASILKKAFEAHKAGNYELSIPAFLAQADGIGRDALGDSIQSIYTQRSDKKAKIKEAVHTFESEAVLGSEFLEILLMPMPLNVSEGNPLLIQDILNRNKVLHGADTNYGTFHNSCRAISWLDYVAFFHKLSSRKKSKSVSKAN